MEDSKMGRPYISGKPKTIKITVMLDEEEHKNLKEKASKNNMTMSEYLRYLAKKEK